MVEGKLQIEGKVINVIVQRCYHITSLLPDITTFAKDDPPVQTLSPADLQPALLESEKIKKHRPQMEQEIFPKEINFE